MSDLGFIRVAVPVRTQVEDALRTAIGNGRFLPGDRFVERELCALLGVSRPLLREALRQLEAEGLINTVPGRGLIVTVLNLEDARNLFAVRAELEGLAARSFAERSDEATIAALRKSIEALELLVATGDAERVRSAKNEFYDLLMRGSGNGILSEMLRMLHNRIQLLRVTNFGEPGRMEKAVIELRGIFDAIERHDGPAAHKLSREHIRNAAAALEQALARRDEADKTRSRGSIETTA
ncbi:GntR family transcriptional regulator [Aurantimonas sp. C2-6-R+9]|uniref:GntR family transcriptional regulator n=1 Tax=unclassified Aurantimonas TaxID=2638230 RepID=UPI002E175AD3|nr:MULTISPECIES: GntR family transcriptional regulator [unclassified Aurantimonas]MEC5293564.1 GntR family transcriptional regulator [Aurantimonas sp. C2-3-R2]MEC5383815.1 GntR family transcriptional regulator [Aurantimonas sp. C2-6-R+9]MEC5414690.1 GntR family transcriptional regulator [Aurantimonas sp. C2-4-R8]